MKLVLVTQVLDREDAVLGNVSDMYVMEQVGDRLEVIAEVRERLKALAG